MEIGADDWLRPRDALKTLNEFFDEYTVTETILRCLRGDQIRSVAMTSALEIRNKPPQKGNPVRLIPAIQWRRAPVGTEWNQFWKTGVIHFPLGEVAGVGDAVVLLCFDVRFDPVGIRALIPPAPAVDDPEQEAPQEQAVEKAKDNVSPAHFEAWWTFYKAVTDPRKETEREAFAHFARCFPSYKVPRQPIRDKRGHPNRGPKPKSAQ